MQPILNTICELVQKEYELKAPKWENTNISMDDINFIRSECNKESVFDKTNKRKEMYDNMLNGTNHTIISKCEYGQLFCVFDTMVQIAELPWDLWGRILRLFSEKRSKRVSADSIKNSKPTNFKIYFFANTSLRTFPDENKEIVPENINGGYTYQCNPETIMIYRAEDATRVLIHELQHSCCLDDNTKSIDDVEAETEAWAELIYIAILSRGKKYIFNDLIKRQSEWMIKQNQKVKKHMKDSNSREFPWRYTIGKENIWSTWGILYRGSMKPDIEIKNSLRLTYPPNNLLKKQFDVLDKSTIL